MLVYAVYVRVRQVNVRLSEDEHRAMRYWAYAVGVSASELARRALVELMERLATERDQSRQQPALPL